MNNNSTLKIKDKKVVLCKTDTKEITIPEGITTIGSDAFACLNLKKVHLPKSLKVIGKGAFYGCNNLTTINLNDNIKTICGGAFFECYSLSNITLSKNLTTIGEFAFCSCDNLHSIVIPPNVKYIGALAFRECGDLTIYCEIDKQPNTWHKDWNLDDNKVVWGYKGSIK